MVVAIENFKCLMCFDRGAVLRPPGKGFRLPYYEACSCQTNDSAPEISYEPIEDKDESQKI